MAVHIILWVVLEGEDPPVSKTVETISQVCPNGLNTSQTIKSSRYGPCGAQERGEKFDLDCELLKLLDHIFDEVRL